MSPFRFQQVSSNLLFNNKFQHFSYTILKLYNSVNPRAILLYSNYTSTNYFKYRMSKKQTPSDFLKQITGKPVLVKLNSGADYRGILVCLDGYMNIALEQTEEYMNGELRNKYGDTLIRGNNVLYISTQKKK